MLPNLNHAHILIFAAMHKVNILLLFIYCSKSQRGNVSTGVAMVCTLKYFLPDAVKAAAHQLRLLTSWRLAFEESPTFLQNTTAAYRLLL